MAYSAKVGSFNIDTTKAATETQSITGVGFQPKIVFFWWSGSTATGDSIAGGDINAGFGAMSGATSRIAAMISSDDAAATSASGRALLETACILSYLNGTITQDGAGDWGSFDADGFTLTIDNQFSTSLRVNYLALGGDDLTNVAIGTFNRAGELGEMSVTGVGFQPDGLITLFSQTDGYVYTDGQLDLGFATGPSNQGVVCIRSLGDVATSLTSRYGYNGEASAIVSDTGVNSRVSLVSFDADGFTLNQLEGVNASDVIGYIALKGGQYIVGDLTTRTDSNDISETVGFQPSAILFASVNMALSTQDTRSTHARLSIGAATSTSNRAVQAVSDENGLADTETAYANYDSAVYAHVVDDAIVGLMDIKSIDASGFTAVMDDTDSSECWVTYLAIGAAASGVSESASPSATPSPSASISPSGSASSSPSCSASRSPSPSSSVSRSASASASRSASSSVSESEAPVIEGTVCWGHDTDVLEDNTRTFADNWTGTGTISGEGDAETICLAPGEYRESEVVYTGERTVELELNHYASP